MLQLVRILSDLLAPYESIAVLYMIKGEDLVVLLAQVTHSKMYGGAVPCRCKHGLCHNSWDIQSCLSLLNLLLLGLATSGCIAILMLVEVLGHSVLSLKLLPRSLGKMRYRITSQSHLSHCIEDCSVGDVVATHQNFSVEPCLVPVDVLSSPQAHC